MCIRDSYNTYNNPSQALKNCKKIMKLTRCDAVKIEGGQKIIKIIENLIKNNFNIN